MITVKNKKVRKFFEAEFSKTLRKYLQMHPAEIENFVETLEGIKGVCVVGVNDKITVLWTKLEGVDVNSSQLATKCEKLFPETPIEGGFHLVESFPRQNINSGKIVRMDATKLAEKLCEQFAC